MATYNAEIIHNATAQYEARRMRHEEEYARRREDVYRRLPRVKDIDRQLRATVARAATAALRQGADPAPAIQALREQHAALKEERGALLKSIGYAEDALNEQPLCPKCGDRGWKGSRMCDCLKALCEEEQVRQMTSMMNLRGQSFQDFRKDYYPPEYQAQMDATYQFCLAYAENFRTLPVRNLFFTGEPGLGKTFLSVCIAREVAAQGCSVVYDSAIHIFDRMEAAKFSGDQEAREASDRYVSCDLLVLDDLGSELTVPSVRSALYNLINTRLLDERHTIISTNLTLADLNGRYSPQVYSRIVGDYKIFPFYGTDIRQRLNRLGNDTSQ